MNPRIATIERDASSGPEMPHGNTVLIDTFTSLCIASGTPISMAAFYRIQESDHIGLCSMKFDPFFYDWNDRYGDLELDYQIVSFFKKYQDFDLGIPTEKLAYDKWLKVEQACSETNRIFRSRWEGISYFPSHVEEVFHLARRKISEILGTIGPNELAYIRDNARHGPGADTALARNNASSYAKYQSAGTITPACVSLYDDIFDADHRADFAHHALIEHDSRLSFVPKTALIDRAICIEPRWNIYLQLGIGSLISKRLRRFGQDITCQDRNQEAARRAYADRLGTIDLSSASDSIASNLVIDLFSTADPMWIDLLLKSRCHYTSYNGKRIRLEKISSMGNGYTFPLETLIFYALAVSAVQIEKSDRRDVSVYGDDIIVPRKAFSLLVETLTCLGFSVNTEKSYANGSFFESCGKDYFKGREVRPFFVKKKLSSVVDAIVLHNQVIDWAGRNQVLPGLLNRSRWLIARRCIYHRIPRRYRLCGPIGLSGVLHTEFSEWKTRRASWGVEGCWIKTFSTVPGFRLRYGYRGLLYSKLHADVNSRHRVVTLGRDRQVLKETLVSQIPDFVIDEARDLRSRIW